MARACTPPPLSPARYMGLWGLSFTTCYTLAFTVPRWGALVAGPTARAGASWRWLAFLFGSHTLSNAAHNLAWCVAAVGRPSVVVVVARPFARRPFVVASARASRARSLSETRRG